MLNYKHDLLTTISYSYSYLHSLVNLKNDMSVSLYQKWQKTLYDSICELKCAALITSIYLGCFIQDHNSTNFKCHNQFNIYTIHKARYVSCCSSSGSFSPFKPFYGTKGALCYVYIYKPHAKCLWLRKFSCEWQNRLGLIHVFLL